MGWRYSAPEPRVELWHRSEDGEWEQQTFSVGETVTVPDLGCELPVDAIYRDPLG